MSAREPLLNPVAIADLRPTQITVGFREVSEKRREWREKGGELGSEYLGNHMIPVVKGPKDRFYVLDHHHLCRALLEEGQAHILVVEAADLSRLKKSEFWTFLDNRGWCHPYDAKGARRDFDEIPGKVADMTDDPYRSLAGELRRAGGYAKETTPFAEFIWADFLRRRVKPALVADDFAAALTKAVKLAQDKKASHLPGWCGPNPID
jgi:hypothetical protein